MTFQQEPFKYRLSNFFQRLKNGISMDGVEIPSKRYLNGSKYQYK